jgi:hypothetical protein
MAKIGNKKVPRENDEKFSLFAICAAESDTRMAWLLNSALCVDFVNKEDLHGAEVDGRRRPFAVFEAVDTPRELLYTLITIRQESEVLIKAYANVDFLLKFSRELEDEELQGIHNAIRMIPSVTACLDVSSDTKLLAGL